MAWMTAGCATYDLNTDKGEVGGSSPPRPTIQTSKYASARETDQAFRDRRNCRPTKRCASESPTWITRNGLPKKTTIDDAEFDGAL